MIKESQQHGRARLTSKASEPQPCGKAPWEPAALPWTSQHIYLDSCCLKSLKEASVRLSQKTVWEEFTGGERVFLAVREEARDLLGVLCGMPPLG